MPTAKQKLIIILLTSALILVFFSHFSAFEVHAGAGAIAAARTFPKNQGTYDTVCDFSYQITAVNTNTTVSVCIDDGPPISMLYQGIENEIGSNDSASSAWHTWHVSVTPITTIGNHTFQFFSHYYVWQDKDHYWAEFNAYSEKSSFSIDNSLPRVEVKQDGTDLAYFGYFVATLTSSSTAILLFSVKDCRFPRKTPNR